jgi:hypothetical protein
MYMHMHVHARSYPICPSSSTNQPPQTNKQQECLILESLRGAIHGLLGKRIYDMFTREIGDTTLLNGMIALVRISV